MRNITYIFILVLLFSCGYKNPYPNKISDFRPELQIQLKKLAKEKELPSKDTIARNYLKENCTKEELLKLLKCENPLLRVIAYRTIVNRNEKDYFKILLGHLNDTTKVMFWYCEDAGSDFMVSDLLINKAVDSKKLTQSQKNILVDNVLLKYSYLQTSNWMLQDIEPNQKYYSIIKEKSKLKTKKCSDQISACYALSKFKKKEDLDFLKNTFNNIEIPCEYWVFKSIEENPNEIYFPILEKYFNRRFKNKKQFWADDLEYYSLAIAKYKNEKSLYLFTELLDKKNYTDTSYIKDNQKYIFKAIHKYKTRIYDDLYNKLKPKMSEYVIENLDKIDDSKTKTW